MHPLTTIRLYLLLKNHNLSFSVKIQDRCSKIKFVFILYTKQIVLQATKVYGIACLGGHSFFKSVV